MYRVNKNLIVLVSSVFIFSCDSIEEEAAHIQLGAANELFSIAGLQYQQPFVVQVTDNDGNPVANSSVRIRVEPISYRKGTYVRLDQDAHLAITTADAVTWAQYYYEDDPLFVDDPLDPDDTPDQIFNSTTLTCSAEDTNNNAVLDAGEDNNNNGIIDPSNTATLTAHPSEEPTLNPLTNRVITDDSGFGYFSITYPETVANWASVSIIATTNVSGTESTQTLDTFLSATLSDMEQVDISPPGGSTISPYGVANICTDPN